MTAGPTGSWTSEAIAVTPGKAYGITVDTAGGRVAIEQLSALGLVLGTLADAQSFTAAVDTAQIRVKLLGGLSGISTFDNVRLWEE
ncbi:MAG TPA: hypothetical protein VM070_08180 [Candidatus Saccharimonadales bacterium]|nr:hypothetical protein [Candidatus Saccharimonadales bacterium]